MSNSLDPDQARHSVGPDPGQNCLQKLSADDTRRLRVTLCICDEYQNLMNLPFCSI